ncbi:MAG: DUF3352 domain-containing protein [Plectolyngbya sp. WJT66-NPBG17]|jgi:hypothetical protein|nr:DUF3352 domain-containing protein [Plectolyngbya sp. WJT66-NPBG17]MBW4526598.1 DUF3352 domain-containing protein [Phormidium tanganyikae FI6-MK23]
MLLKRSLFTTLAALSLVTVPELTLATPKVLAQPASVTSPVTRSTSMASILPAETLGVVMINTQNDRWKALSQFNLFPNNLTFPGRIFYPTNQETSFEEDIQPWLGDQFGVALLSAKSILMVSSVKDQTALDKYVNSIRAFRKAPKEIQYKGATILEFQPEKRSGVETELYAIEEDQKPVTPPKPKPRAVSIPVPKLAIAVLPGYFVSANSAEAIQEMLDAQSKLSENPKFQRIEQNPRSAQSIAMLYGKYIEALKAINQIQQVQLEEITKNAPNAPALPNFALDPTLIDPLAQFYDTAEGYVWAESTGLRAQFGVNLKQAVPENLLTPLTTRNQILQRLPEVNYMVANSQNLSLYWRVLTVGLDSQPTWKKYLEQARQSMQSAFGVDDRDLAPWMNGEYVVFAYPTNKGFIPATSSNMDIALGMMVQTDDRAAAETALNKFTAFVTPRLGKPLVQQSTIAGQPFINYGAVNNGRSLNFFSHGWTDENTLLMLFGGGSLSEFNPKPTRNLTQTPNFKSAIEPFPNANLGYFYVNQGAFMSFVNNGLLPVLGGRSMQGNPFVTQVQDSLGSIRSISGASTITSDQVQFEGFLALSPRLKR